MASLTLAALPSMSLTLKEFGEGSVNHVEKLLTASVGQTNAGYFVEVFPQLTCLFAAGAAHLQATDISYKDQKLQFFNANAGASMKALYGLVSGPDVVFMQKVTSGGDGPKSGLSPSSTASLHAFRQRVLAAQDILPPPLAGNSSDMSALRFLAEVSGMSSPADVTQALKERRGQEFVRALHSSSTLASMVCYASWWDDAWDWIKGAAGWVSDAAKTFGEEAAKVANAVVEGACSHIDGGAKVLEGVPGVGLVVAGIYYMAGKTDEGTAALAINLNAIVTTIASAVGLAAGGPAGAMIGGALGKAAGLLLQEAVAKLIQDRKLREDVGDVSATRFVIEVALSGAASAGAGAIGTALGQAAGRGAVLTFATSQSLAALLAGLPHYLTTQAAAQTKD